jgi:hypothetical protein
MIKKQVKKHSSRDDSDTSRMQKGNGTHRFMTKSQRVVRLFLGRKASWTIEGLCMHSNGPERQRDKPTAILWERGRKRPGD